jgi:TonB family protein
LREEITSLICFGIAAPERLALTRSTCASLDSSNQMISVLHIGLVTTITVGAGTVLAQPSPPYMPAQRLPCQYGLTLDALRKLPPEHLGAAVRVSIDAQGNVKEAVLERSSGDAAFDALTVRQSRKAVCNSFLDVDGTAIPVVTNFVFAVAAA